MRRSCLALLVLLWSAAVSSGGVIGLVTENTTFSAPEAALTGHKGYALSMMTDDGSSILAIDVRIAGRLHQRWQFDNDVDLFVQTPRSNTTSNGDSHLNPALESLVSSAYIEDNSFTGSPLVSTTARSYGYGTFLKGSWVIPESSRTNTATLAYIVLPNGEAASASVTGQVATSTGTFPITIPQFWPPPILTTSPAVGSGVECDFCSGVTSLPISLSNTGGGVINVLSIALAGPSAANFVLTGMLPTQLVGGAPPSTFNVGLLAPSQPGGIYTAQVLVNTNAGNLVFDVGGLCPEPSALLLAAIVLLPLTRRIRLFTSARNAYL